MNIITNLSTMLGKRDRIFELHSYDDDYLCPTVILVEKDCLFINNLILFERRESV